MVTLCKWHPSRPSRPCPWPPPAPPHSSCLYFENPRRICGIQTSSSSNLPNLTLVDPIFFCLLFFQNGFWNGMAPGIWKILPNNEIIDETIPPRVVEQHLRRSVGRWRWGCRGWLIPQIRSLRETRAIHLHLRSIQSIQRACVCVLQRVPLCVCTCVCVCV